MKVLVTGATGFVGAALCRFLSEQGDEVWATCRDERPVRFADRVVRLVSIDGGTDWMDALYGVDVVFHLAGLAHRSFRDDDLARVNVEGSQRLARDAVASGVPHIVFLGSVKVHGDSSGAAIRACGELAPSDAYGRSKKEAERGLREAVAGSETAVTIIRAPLVYGPGVRANFLRLLSAVDRGLPLPLGSVANRRSLIYLGNLIDALRFCSVEALARGRTYLVSDGHDLSTPELVRSLARLLDVPPRVFPFPVSILRVAAKLTGSQSVAERLLDSLFVDDSEIRACGWRPPFSMEAGLAETIRWYRAQNE